MDPGANWAFHIEAGQLPERVTQVVSCKFHPRQRAISRAPEQSSRDPRISCRILSGGQREFLQAIRLLSNQNRAGRSVRN